MMNRFPVLFMCLVYLFSRMFAAGMGTFSHVACRRHRHFGIRMVPGRTMIFIAGATVILQVNSGHRKCDQRYHQQYGRQPLHMPAIYEYFRSNESLIICYR